METDHDGISINMPSLTAVGEGMLVLFLVAILSISVQHAMLVEGPLTVARSQPQLLPSTCRVTAGPGDSLSLDDHATDMATLLETLRASVKNSRIELQAREGVNLGFYWNLRYRLRQAGFGYVETMPDSES